MAQPPPIPASVNSPNRSSALVSIVAGLLLVITTGWAQTPTPTATIATAAAKAVSVDEVIRNVESKLTPQLTSDELIVMKRELLFTLGLLPEEVNARQYPAVQQIVTRIDEYIRTARKAERNPERLKAEAHEDRPMGLDIVGYNADVPDTPAVLAIVKHSWRLDGFGAVAIWTITFWNHSSEAVGNIKYHTTYDSETSIRVDEGGGEKRIIQKVIKPHQKRTIEINDGFVHSEAHSGQFNIVSFQYIP